MDLVECRSSNEYAERPVALHWEGQRLEVAEVIARWMTPEGKHFKVRTTDEQVFELVYNQTTDEWRIRNQS